MEKRLINSTTREKSILAGDFELNNTEQLTPDPVNPRKISKRGEVGLAASLTEYGDLSGIVFNRRTGQLVAGHQRLKQIREKYGDLPIESIDPAAGLFGIRVDDNHFFSVRVVDWSAAKQRAANVTANNHKIGGEFSEGLESYLLEFKSEITEEIGTRTLDDTLLLDLIATPTPDSGILDIKPVFQVVVECESESQQKQRYEQLKSLGFSCKVITV